jgi:hypothetical protein
MDEFKASDLYRDLVMVPMIEFRRGLDTIINDAIDKMK